jgi:radical SAM superfamily enzyme YgiQ (UPF0313 family)
MNLASLAGFLLKQNIEVRIWDFDVEVFNKDFFLRRLGEYAPEIVGISCCTPTIINAHSIAGLVKRYNKDTLIVIGGPHASALPERTLKEFPYFDVVVIGEGEQSLLDICCYFNSSTESLKTVDGLVYRYNTAIFRTPQRRLIPDLDNLPFPARELLPIHLYRGQSHRGFSRDFLKITELMTSRGCPGKCIFCASEVIMGDSLRFRSAQNVSDEINLCVGRFGFNHFTISDDNFILNIPRLRKICESFKRLNVTWNCNARVWPISKEILVMMAKSGCTGITFGVESGSPRILELLGKNISVQQIKDAFRWSREAGIKLIEADLIIGSHPSENYEDIDLSIRLINKIRPDIIMASVIVPYPGTKVYELMKMKGLLELPEKWQRYLLYGSRPAWRTEHFGPEELLAMQKDILKKFYLNPIYILRRFRSIRNFSEFRYWFSAGIEFLYRTLRR